MQTDIDLPITHTHKKHKSFLNDDFDTIEVQPRPIKKSQLAPKLPVLPKQHLEAIPETQTISPSKPKVQLQSSTLDPQPKNSSQVTLKAPSAADQAISSINSQKQSISNNLETILSHYKEINDNEFLFSGHNPKKEFEIKEFLTKLKKDKKDRKERIQSLSVQIPKKDQNTASEQIIERKKRIEQRYQRKVKELEDAQKKRDEEHNKFKEFYKEYKNSKPYYLQKNEEAKELAEKHQMEIQQALNHHAKKFKPISEDQFREHIQKYQETRRQFEEAKQYQRQQYKERIQEENEKLEEIWKGNFYRLAEEEKAERKKLKQQPKEMRKKIKEYAKQVRENYLPKSSRKYEDDIVRERFRSAQKKPQTHRVLKRYKYVNGQAFGQVQQKIPLEISQKDKRKIGNAYLQMVRALPKKKQQAPVIPQTPQPEPQKPRKQPVPRQVRLNNPLYDVNRSITLSPNPGRQELQTAIYHLKNFDTKVNQEQKILKLQKLPSVLQYQERQRAINMKLVKGIEEKLNLLAQM